MMKKTIVILVLCAMALLIVQPAVASTGVKKQNFSMNHAGRTSVGFPWGPCIELIIICMEGYICIRDLCRPSDEAEGSAEIGMCESKNEFICSHKCTSCGYASEGTGPSSVISHGCR